MDKIQLLGILGIFGFTGILFSPTGTDYWKYPLIIGLILGCVWFWKS